MSVIPVLMYHSISDDGQKMSVSKHNFYKQAKIMLKLGFKSVNLKDIFNDKSKKKFVITFDDGYQDVFTNAYPILKELNLKATCFFVINKIGKYNEWDSNKSDYKKRNIMNDDQILQWYKSGLEVGSHSLDHENLIKVNDTKKREQIIMSKLILKEKYNIDVKSFSYPFGQFDDDCVKIIKQNYEYAVTTKRSRFKTKIFETSKIPRVPINSDTTIFKFLIKTLTIYEDIKFKS